MEIIKTNLEFNSNKTKRNISDIKRIILHNSGVTVLQSIEIIHDYHKNTRGYARYWIPHVCKKRWFNIRRTSS